MKNEKYLLAEKEYHENHNEKYYEIPEGFWVLYEEFEAYYLEYQELYFHYYDDLLCYALMYNNISLYPPISIYHIIYFVRRKNEIIGYANKIENKQQLSINEKVLLMCFNNIYRFDYAFKNYKYYIKGNGGGNIFSFLDFNSMIKEKKISLIWSSKIEKGIKDLSEEQCQKILEEREKLNQPFFGSINRNYFDIDNYAYYCSDFIDITDTINCCGKDYEIYRDFKEITFIEQIYIPLMYSNDYPHRFMRKMIKKYIKRIAKKEGKEIIDIPAGVNRYMKDFNTYKSSYLYSSEHLDNEYEQNQHEKCKSRCKGLLKSIVRALIINTENRIGIYNNKYVYDESIFYKNKEMIKAQYTEFYNFLANRYAFNNPKECRSAYQVRLSYDGLLRGKIDTDFIHYKTPFNETIWAKKLRWRLKSNLKLCYREKYPQEWIKNIQAAYKHQHDEFMQNIYCLDESIKLDTETHKYIVNDYSRKGECESITTFVKKAFPKFDVESHALRQAVKLGMTTDEVIEMWEQKGRESRELGVELHSKIEKFYKGINSTDDETFKLFKTFANSIKLKPFRMEWAVYDWEHKIAGTIDFVDYQNGEYIIYDWKRSEKIIENGMPVKINKYGEKGNYPLEHLDNTPYYHYALQLSLYKYILEKNYGMKISDLRLGIFHPTYNKPYVLRMPYLEKEINDLFNLRSEVLF